MVVSRPALVAILALVGCAGCSGTKSTATPARGPQVGKGREDRPVETREAVIRRTRLAIEAGCPGGDWRKWQQDTEPYRAALKAKIEALQAVALRVMKPHPALRVSDDPKVGYVTLAGRNEFPLFECGAQESLNYIYNPKTLDEFLRQRPVVAANCWLRKRGIDLVFVPVPRMAEVYVEQFFEPCPADGIVAPHIRRVLLDLLKEDVEVVDGFALFRPVRKPDPEYLFNPADSHWAPRGMRVMARELADRLQRYDFGRTASQSEPVANTVPVPSEWPQDGWEGLTPRQKELAATARPKSVSDITPANSQAISNILKSPVLVIGNSYAFRFCEEFARELNLLVSRVIGGG
jgi:hypothetical protein